VAEGKRESYQGNLFFGGFMKKSKRILAVLLLLLGSTWAYAQEEVTVKVSGDRTAVINVVSPDAGDPDVSGTVKGAADFKDGKSGLRADLTIKNEPDLQGAQADLFANMTGSTIELIGYLNAKLPPDEANAPKALDVDLKTVTDGDQSGANFDINFEGPINGEPVPKGSGKASMEGDFKAFTSSGDFEFSGGNIKGSDVPFKKFELSITEKENKTTIAFTVSAPKDSDMAKQLDSLPDAGKMLEANLPKQNIKFENLKFPAPTVEGSDKVAKGELTLIDVRGTIKPFLPFIAQNMQGVPDANKALEEILQARLDKFSLTLDVGETSLKGTFGLDASSLDHFWTGYLTLMPSLQQISNQQMMSNAGEFGVFLGPLLKLNTEQAVESMKLLATSAMKLKGEANFNMDTKGADTDPKKTMTFKANGDLMATNYKDYVTKAKAAGLPVAEKAVGKLTLNLKDKTTLEGQAYLFTDGNIVNYYKGMLAKAAKEAQAPEDVQKAITDLELKEVGLRMSLKDNKVTVLSRGTTSDLTKIAGLLIKQAAPQFAADLTGGSVDVNMDDKGTGKADVKIFFANFFPGKDAAGIKEALGLPSNAKVSMDASAGDVQMVAVEQPEIAVDGKLAEVQEDGKKLLASSPNDVASGGGGGSAGKTGLIALGVLLLLGVGGFLAFGNKKS
jgi:hypothetical protein